MKNPLDLANVDIEITKIPLAHFVASKKKTYYMEDREYYCFILITKGSMTFVMGNEQETAFEGDILMVNKGEDYTIKYNEKIKEDSTEFFIVEFDIANKDLSFLSRVNKVNHPEIYVDIMKQLERYCNFFHIAQGGYLLKSKSLLYELIYDIFKEKYKAHFSPLETNLEKAKNHIDSNFKNKITIEDLAEIAGYSVPYFKRSFKKFYKISPGEYLNELRINKAKAMLASKMYTIAEIAVECGFSSESYFSHAFKNAVGVSPKRF